MNKADGQPLDDEWWQLCTLAAPLLFSIAFDEYFVDVPADK